MEGRFKVETQRVLDELEMVRGRNAQEAEVAALRSERFSEAIAVAGTPTELADVKPKSDVLSRPMPRDSGNNGGDREMVQRGDGIESSSSGQVEPSTVRGQGKPSGKNGKAKSGEKKNRRLTTIMERMGEGGVASIGGGRRVQAAKSRERLGPVDGINAAKQGSRRGKAVEDKAVKPRKKPDAIANDRAIKSGARLDEATCSKVAESRGKHGETTSSQVVKPGSRRDETASVKAVEHRKGPGAIASDKAVKPRVKSEQVCSQYARMESWSKLRRLRHKGTLKEYKKTSKAKPKAEGSGRRFQNEGKSDDEEGCSSSGREDPLNDEPDGESGDNVRNLGTSSSAEDAKPRVRAEQTRGRKLKVPEVLQDYPRGAEWEASSNLRVRRDEARRGIGLCREKVPMQDGAKNSNDKGSMRGVSDFIEQEGLTQKFEQMPTKSEGKVGQDLTLNADEKKFGWDPRLCRKGQGGPNQGKSRLVGKSSYGRDALVGVLAHFITWRQEPKQAQPLWDAESLWGDMSKQRRRKATMLM
ncbi:ribosome-binding protein 1-like [Hibiscus syriacus]|uniref:ribosome-binding protein 1-like n=1 Tax=Hibiscus syriacus TaxID=106335 RepID=UPI0019225B5C|nr:ribosome-binding protein 1-like [Hibiscus syriacus]